MPESRSASEEAMRSALDAVRCWLEEDFEELSDDALGILVTVLNALGADRGEEVPDAQD